MPKRCSIEILLILQIGQIHGFLRAPIDSCWDYEHDHYASRASRVSDQCLWISDEERGNYHGELEAK